MPNHDKLLQLAKQAGIADRNDIKKLLHIIDKAPNKHIQQKAAEQLRTRIQKHLEYPFPQNPEAENPAKETLELGFTPTGSKVQLPVEDLSQHLLTIGQTGAGKTTLFYNLMSEADRHGIPFWVFDLKQDYRHLIKDIDLTVFPLEKFRMNPLKPPSGVHPKQWGQRVAEIFCDSQALLDASQNYLKEQIDSLFHQYGVYDPEDNLYPSTHELQSFIEDNPVNYTRKKANYRDTVLNRLNSVNSDIYTTFECSSGFSLEKLLQQNLVFELDDYSSNTQNFFMEILMAKVYAYRKSQNHRGGGIRHLFFLDESKTILSKYKEQSVESGIPVIDKLVAEMREFEEGIVAADQEASKLTDSIKANTKTKILLATGDAKEFESIAESLKMDTWQKDWAQRLAVGEAVIQKGSYQPFPVILPDYPLEKDVTDDELVDRQTEVWQSFSFQPMQSRQDLSSSRGSDQAEQPEKTGEETVEDADKAEYDVDERAKRLLQQIVETPYQNLTDQYQSCGFSRYKGTKAKDQLVDVGLVEERKVQKKYGQPTLLELTEEGREYCESVLGLDVEWDGRGGVVHRYWQRLIQDAFEEAGFDTEIEVDDADVAVQDDELVAVEVALSDEDREVEHVEQRLRSEFDKVVVGCRSEAVRDSLKEKLVEKDLLGGSVDVRLLQDLQEVDEDAL